MVAGERIGSCRAVQRCFTEGHRALFSENALFLRQSSFGVCGEFIQRPRGAVDTGESPCSRSRNRVAAGTWWQGSGTFPTRGTERTRDGGLVDYQLNQNYGPGSEALTLFSITRSGSYPAGSTSIWHGAGPGRRLSTDCSRSTRSPSSSNCSRTAVYPTATIFGRL